MPQQHGKTVLAVAVGVGIAGVALANNAGVTVDPTGGWMGLFAQMPLAGALMWIFQRVMDRDREREANLLQRDREREAAASKRDELFATRDNRISEALTELGHSLDKLSLNCRAGRNDRAP